MGVSKNRGKTPKMDGVYNGKPYEQMDDLGGFYTPIFGNTHIVYGKGTWPVPIGTIYGSQLQVASGRFGVTAAYLRSGVALENHRRPMGKKSMVVSGSPKRW